MRTPDPSTLQTLALAATAGKRGNVMTRTALNDKCSEPGVGGQAILSRVDALTAFGVAVLTFMIVMYALEARGDRFVLGFAVGCALSSVYGSLSGAWPFGVIEAIWCGLATRRYLSFRAAKS